MEVGGISWETDFHDGSMGTAMKNVYFQVRVAVLEELIDCIQSIDSGKMAIVTVVI